ncbi:MAG: hypothetical protein AUG44_17550 [Actinobacteria bacterium 13_1_20CM_3_71_11]|nr:MAG: hypothetical protein AUG44_17550 [Actinobacteria bacterium 13_1_20CM_3_71_11]TML25825.1 MAG: hypothetical protein E6G35_11505 [Actinomycetota bacterium]
MRGWVWVVIGVLVGFAGVIWTLQGLNLVGGSFMSGKTLWAVIGPLVVLVGLVLIGLGIRTVRRTPAPKD